MKSRQYNTGRFPAPAICTRAVEQTEIAQFAETLGDGGRGAHVDEQERALLDPGVMIASGGKGEQHAGADEVVDTEEENHANRPHHRSDEVEGADSRKASPGGHIDDGDDENDDADVKDRTQREIGQKRQRTDEAACVRLSTNCSSEIKLAAHKAPARPPLTGDGYRASA